MRLARAKTDGLNVGLEEGRSDARGLQRVGPADAEGRIEDRRVVDHDVLLGARRAVQIGRDQPHRSVDQLLGQLPRVGDGGRGQDEARVGSIEAAHAPQPAQHVGDVRAEDAAVDVQLVDHDPAQVVEEAPPSVDGGAGCPACSMSGLVSRRRASSRIARALRGGRVAVVGAARGPAPATSSVPQQIARGPRPGPAPAPWSGRGRAARAVGLGEQRLQRPAGCSTASCPRRCR